MQNLKQCYIDLAYAHSDQEGNLQQLTGHVVGASVGIPGLDD